MYLRGVPGRHVLWEVEGQPEAGVTYEFSSNGDAYSVTVERTETNEDGEITCFEFASDDDIQQVCVKGAPDTATYTDPGDDLLCAPTNPGGQDSDTATSRSVGPPAANRSATRSTSCGGGTGTH